MSLPSRRTAVAFVATASVAALALPAGAATTSTTTPSRGVARSSLTILGLDLAGTTVTAGQLAGVAGNASTPHVARLVITPISSSLTGPLGRQTITPGGGTDQVPSSPKSVSLPSGLGAVTGPTFGVKAVDDATEQLATATLKTLGSVQLLTVPLDLGAASLTDTSKVTGTTARAEKSLSLAKLGLPSVLDLLTSLGVDVDALLDRLTQGNLTKLSDLVGGSVASLNAAVDSAQAQLTGLGESAANTLNGALTEQSGASDALDTATNAFDSALSTALADGVLGPLLSGLGISASSTPAQVAALAPNALLNSLIAVAQDAVDAQTVLDAVNALVDAIQALVNGVLDALQNNDDPLAALGNISITTKAVAARTPTAIAGVNVGSIDVLGALTTVANLTSKLGEVTGTLSDVLESVSGVAFTPPAIALGTPQHATSRTGSTRSAVASITGITMRLPSITLPSALQLAGVPDNIGGTLKVGVLGERATWTPASTTTGSTPDTPNGTPNSGGGGTLAGTGSKALLPVLALVVLGGALALRRRLTT